MDNTSDAAMAMPTAIYIAGLVLTMVSVAGVIYLLGKVGERCDKQIDMINNSMCYRQEQAGCVEECIVWASKCDAVRAANENGTPIPPCVYSGGC